VNCVAKKRTDALIKHREKKGSIIEYMHTYIYKTFSLERGIFTYGYLHFLWKGIINYGEEQN